MTPWALIGSAGGLAAQAWQVAMSGCGTPGCGTWAWCSDIEDALADPGSARRTGRPARRYAGDVLVGSGAGRVACCWPSSVVLLRRDAHSLGAALLGLRQVRRGLGRLGRLGERRWSAVCGGLTRAVLRSLLHVSSFCGWHPSLRISPEAGGRRTVATVLGLLGLVLWVAALGQIW